MSANTYILPNPVLWTERLKFTDVVIDDPRRLLITDICYAIGGDDRGDVRLDGNGGHASHMYAAHDIALYPGLWVVEADAMEDWGVRCYRSRIRYAGPTPTGTRRTEEREQGVDAGMVTYAFAKPGDTDVYDSFHYYNLPPEQMIWLRNEFGYYSNPNVKGRPNFEPSLSAIGDIIDRAKAEGHDEGWVREHVRVLDEQARTRGIESMKTGFVTATTGSGNGDGGYPVLLTFVGDLLIQAETYFSWSDDEEENADA